MLPKQENLSLARQLSLQALSNADPAERAACSGSRMEHLPEGRRRIGVRYLGREVWLSLPGGTIEVFNGGSPVAMREEVLILHYLEKAPGRDLTGTWISFAESWLGGTPDVRYSRLAGTRGREISRSSWSNVAGADSSWAR